MSPYKDSLKKGSIIPLVAHDVTVTTCTSCGKKMVNVDKRDVTQSDLYTLKRLGIKISNPFTKDPVCVDCDEDDTDDDNYSIGSMFADAVRSIPSTSHSSGFGSFGGFGGFGGGGFSGGGASRGW